MDDPLMNKVPDSLWAGEIKADALIADPWVILNARGEFIAVCHTLEIAQDSIRISYPGVSSKIVFDTITRSHCHVTTPNEIEYEIVCKPLMTKADCL